MSFRAVWPLFLIAAALLTAGAGRLVYIQRNDGPALLRKAEEQNRVKIVIGALRGEIVDARGRVLAQSTRKSSVFVDPSQVQDARFVAYSIAPLLQLDAAALERSILDSAGKRFLWVKRDVTDDEVALVTSTCEIRKLGAVGVLREPARAYPCGKIATQVLGFVGVDPSARAGVELEFDALLQGTDGWRTATVDVRRRRLDSGADEFVAPRDGATVVLTIDAYLQQFVEATLRKYVAQFKCEWGGAVVMDPWSGEVLAMASTPDFDPDEPIPDGLSPAARAAAEERLQNRTIAFSFEPGSTFKPFIASAALNEGLVSLGEVFHINGPTRKFGARTIHDTKPYGSLTMHEIISKSSNIGMSLIGERVRNERLHRYVRQFGFGEVTGIDLPGEQEGMVHALRAWGPFSTQSIPIGQEIAVTPIQIATAFCVFCNEGELVRPRIVRGVIGADGTTIADKSQPIVVRRVLEPATAQRFRMEALVETVTHGTGQKTCALPEHQAFGKTGTAQIARRGGHGYLKGAYCANFVGGAPAGRPRAAVVVTMYHPRGDQYYGSAVAGPAFKEIMAETLAYLQVPAEFGPDGAPRPGADAGSSGD